MKSPTAQKIHSETPQEVKNKAINYSDKLVMERNYCYIAGKIGDLPKEVYTALFYEAAGEVEALGYNPITPLDLTHDHDKSWTSYMREDVQAMLHPNCNTVYALRNWRHSTGATIEIDIALKLGLNIIQQPMKPL